MTEAQQQMAEQLNTPGRFNSLGKVRTRIAIVLGDAFCWPFTKCSSGIVPYSRMCVLTEDMSCSEARKILAGGEEAIRAKAMELALLME